MRLFFAIELPWEVQRILAGCQDGLRAGAGKVRWSRPEGLHLTLAFIGEANLDAQAQLERIALETAAGHRPFRLETAGLGGFPDARAASVLWAGLGLSSELAALADDLRSRLLEAGLPFDAKPLSPHLTLARCPRPVDCRGWAGPPPAAFGVDGFALFESQSAPGGAQYLVLQRFPLAFPGDRLPMVDAGPSPD
jgi:2'-5' RNA ligase